MVELINLKKIYGKRTVLDIEAFAFRPGGRYAVIGPNGSGKSTLLRLIAGIIEPDGGSVVLPEDSRRTLGYLPQQPYSFDFSVQKNVMLAFHKQKGAEEAARAALQKVGMERFADARGNRLSGGEAQRMALARMIALPRRLILLDEPSSSTDIAGSELIERALMQYCAETGCTLIFSTHSPAQAQSLAQDLLMLDGGKLVESGPAEDVLFRPKQAVTQAFLRHWRLGPESK